MKEELKVQVKKPDFAFSMQKMVSLAGEFGFIIAVPLVLFGIGGRWLDARYHAGKIYTLVGIGFALCVSTIVLVRRIGSIRSELTQKNGP